ncbi:MAG TPA: S1/P1 nuclease [Gemmatimonadales bacterium]|nr:S1/P1 nuclease [Gemmatimonadales bacterium]
MSTRRFLMAASLLLLPVSAQAWGVLGHHLTVRLAMDYLTGDVRKEVRRLLNAPTMIEASTWADSIRPQRQTTGPWHYIDVPVDSSFAGWAKYCPAEGCVLSAIERYSRILADRSRPDAERAEALKFVIHFVGDLHQPLHVGERGDRGGNDVKVTWQGRPANLHSAWDTYLISSPGLDEDQWLGRLRKTAKRMNRKEVGSGTPVDWAAESHALSRDHVYAIPSPPELADSYAAENLPRAEQRLAQAGIRLAALLNQLLKK